MEEGIRNALRTGKTFAAMNRRGQLFSKSLLGLTLLRRILDAFRKRLNFFRRPHGKTLQVVDNVRIRRIQPELIELIGRCTLRIEPDVPAFRLSELTAIALGN